MNIKYCIIKKSEYIKNKKVISLDLSLDYACCWSSWPHFRTTEGRVSPPESWSLMPAPFKQIYLFDLLHSYLACIPMPETFGQLCVKQMTVWIGLKNPHFSKASHVILLVSPPNKTGIFSSLVRQRPSSWLKLLGIMAQKLIWWQGMMYIMASKEI